MAKIVNQEKNVVSIEFEIPKDEFEKSLQKAYLKMRGRINIPGFRKGKAPRKIIEMNYGKEIFYQDALDIALPDAYEEALKALELDPINTPKVDIKELEEGQNVLVAAEVEILPEVQLANPEEVEAEKVVHEVTDEDVDVAIKQMQEQNARMIDVKDRPVKDGDTVVIDYKGFVGEEQFEGGTADNHTLEIGSGSFIPGFEEGLIGKESGIEVEVPVVFPEAYQSEDLAGKEAIFKVTIHEIKEKELPELDDEFAKDVSEFDTMEELRKDTRENMEKRAKDNELVGKQNAAVSAFVEASQVEVPEVLVEKEIDYQIKNFEQQMTMQGINLDDYYKMMGANADGLRNSIRPQAAVSAKTELVIEKLINEKDFEVGDEEIDQELEKLAQSYKIEEEEKLQEFKENLKTQSLDYLKGNIQRKKAIEYLADTVKFVEKKNTEEKAEA